MGRDTEYGFVLSFVQESFFDIESSCRQLRSLWTAFCLHWNLDVDTAPYDKQLRDLWAEVKATEDDTAYWSDYNSFDLYMGDELC